MEKFSKLRFHEFAKAAAAATVSGALALHPGPADAVPVNVGSGTGVVQITAGKAKWFVNNDITFSSTSSAWGFSEASLQTTAGTRHDAFDGVLSWHVNPVPAPGNLYANEYRSPNGTIDISPNYPTDPNVATTLIAAPQTLQGLNVTGQMYFMTSKAVVRSILNLQNPTAAPITVSVLSASNLGSDANTNIQTTSSGDNLFDTADNWFVSSETATPTTSNDPILTYAFQGQGGAVRGTNISGFATGNQSFYETYTVTVPANGTASVMIFVQMSGTVAGAETDASVFNSLSSLQSGGYLAGLSQTQLAQVVNWNIAMPTLAWNPPAAITYGTALGATQLDATATYNSSPVAGTFTYTPPAGTVLHAGAGQALSATFVPTDTSSYATPTSPVTTTLTVNPAPLTITANDATRVYGAPTPTFTASYNAFVNGDTSASLTALPTFSTGATVLSPVGSYAITASGAVDGDYTITYATGTFTITQASTTTAVVAPGSASVGSAVNVSANVAVVAPGTGTPTGTVTITDTTDGLSCSYSLGAVTPGCTITPTSAGTKSLTASYAGDTNFSTSSGAGALTIGQATSGTALASSINPSNFGQAVTFTATVTPGAGGPTPTGTVNFTDGATVLCANVSLSAASAACSTSALSTGSHTIQASYSGDTNTVASNATLTQTVNAASTSMSLAAAPAVILSGQTVSLTATVNGLVPGSVGAPASASAPRTAAAAGVIAAVGPTGTVTFLDGATTLGAIALSGTGTATLNVSTLSIGTHTLTANYAGDGNFAPATASATVTVNPSSPPVPAPSASTWMLTLLGLGLACVGLRHARMLGSKR